MLDLDNEGYVVEVREGVGCSILARTKVRIMACFERGDAGLSVLPQFTQEDRPQGALQSSAPIEPSPVM